MVSQYKKTISAWFGDITNLAALLAIAIVIYELFSPARNAKVLVLGVGTLIFIVILRYADVGRFKDAALSQEGIPSLGLARGSVRAFLAFGFLVGFGLYIYYATTS